MKLKRFAAALLALCLMLTLLPGGVSAEVEEASGDGWSLSTEGVLTVTKNLLSSSGSSWSARALDIKKVVIGRDVTAVSGNAFSECANIESFTVEEGNTTFSNGADGVLYSADGKEIACYPAAHSDSYAGKDNLYIVPKSIVKVCLYAFSGLVKSGRQLDIYAFEDTRSSVASYDNGWVGEDFPDGEMIHTHTYVPVTGVRLDKETMSVEVDGTGTLNATVLPANATFKEVSWTSEAERLARVDGVDGVDGSGTVTGVSAGTVNIVVTTTDGGGYTASCTVTVVKKDVNGLELSPDSLTLYRDQPETLTARVTPFNATYRNISFLSTDRDVVEISVEGGAATDAVTVEAVEDEERTTASASITVQAVNPGTASIIAATADGGYYAVCEVTVPAPDFKLDNNTLELTLPKGSTETKPFKYLTALDGDTPFDAVRWYSSNKHVVSVSEESGAVTTVTARNPGQAVVVARSGDGTQRSCAVTVWDTPTDAGVSMTTLTLAPEDTKGLYAVLLPATAKQDVTWSSSDDSIASVDGNGVVTAVADGTATITVESAEFDDIKAECVVTVQTSVTGVTLNQTSLTLDEGETGTLIPTVAPENATDQTVEWISYNEDVATVVDGEVTAVGPGTTKILAVTADGGKTAECTVTVNATKVTGVTLNEHAVTLNLGSLGTDLTATVEPEGARNQTLTYSFTCSDSTVVSLSDGDGNSRTVTAEALGTATVTVTVTVDGRDFTDTCIVTVVPTAVESVTIEPGTLSLIVGNSSAALTVKSSLDAITQATPAWSSSNEAVATVNGGIVTAAGVGTALITATVTDQLGQVYTASCAVTVTPVKVTGIELEISASPESPPYISLPTRDDTEILTARLLPAGATDQKITFLSTNRDVFDLGIVGSGVWSETGAVTVEAVGGSANVTVRARNPGTAYIIATTEDGGFTAQCTVTVDQPVRTVSIMQGNDVTVDLNDTVTLNAIVLPENAPQTVTWSSDNTEVAEVNSQTGAVTAKKGGTATITATAGGVSATCTVTVRVAVETVELNKNDVELELGGAEAGTSGEVDLTATVKPEDATNQQVHWYSSDRYVAEVDESGHVTAQNPGTAAIIAATDDGGQTAICVVMVYNKLTQPELNKNKLAMTVGESEALLVIINEGADQRVKWSSSAPGIAAVDENTGVVTAKSAGVATITVTSLADGSRSASCTVTVTDTVVLAEGVTLKRDNEPVSSLVLNRSGGDVLATLTAIVYPDNATDKTVTWMSTDEKVVKVEPTTGSSAIVTAVGPGTATILAATADGGHMAWCAVTVQASVAGVTLNRSSMAIGLDQTSETLIAAVEPYNAVNTKVSFTVTEGTDVIELIGDGNIVTVIPKKEGYATVTVTTQDGGKTAVCAVAVSQNAGNYIKIAPASLSLVKGETMTEPLSVTLSPNIGGAPTTVWSSSNEAVATVSGGTVTAVSVGTALITATVTDQEGQVYTASCAVTVTPAPVVSVTGITLNNNKLSLAKEEDATLEATIVPSGATNPGVIWHSTNETVATVNGSGKVTAVGVGTATIVATAKDGGFSVPCTVTVTSDEVTGLTLNKTELSLAHNKEEEKIAVLTAAVAGGSNPTVAWSSSNDEVVRIGPMTGSSTTVTVVGPGTATITASVTQNGMPDLTATCEVKVRTAVTGLTLSPENVTLEMGGTNAETLTATVTPNEAENKEVTWYSFNPAVATVNDGIVTAVGPGTTAIVAATVDGGYASSCIVTVHQKVTGVTLNKNTLTLTEGDREALVAFVTPDGANQQVKWISDDDTIAEVDQNGIVTAKNAGKAVISATTNSETATCTVTVNAQATGVTLDKATLTMYVGDPNTTLTATVTPVGTDYGGLNWSTSDNTVADVSDSGMITVKGPGTAVITVATADGKYTATCIVTVWKETTGLKLNKTSLALAPGDSWGLAVETNPSENPAVRWSIERGSEYVDVTQDGLVTAKSAGEAVIVATAARVAEGCSGVAVCTVKVGAYKVSTEIEAPTMTISGEGTTRTVTLRATAGDEIWYSTTQEPESQKYDTSISVTDDTTIRAYAVRNGYQSAVITGVINMSGASGGMILTDRMGNAIESVTEATAGETDLSFTANITLPEDAVKNAANIYVAVYDDVGALIGLEKFEIENVTAEGTDDQVISQYLKLKIPEGKTIGKISLMVLSEGKAPVMGAGTLNG